MELAVLARQNDLTYTVHVPLASSQAVLILLSVGVCSFDPFHHCMTGT
jgi:hypothetical protein